MGAMDRVRILIAAIVGAVYYTGQITGTVVILLGIHALALLVTGKVGICSSYIPSHFSMHDRA